jgi:hypothetical protein
MAKENGNYEHLADLDPMRAVAAVDQPGVLSTQDGAVQVILAPNLAFPD